MKIQIMGGKITENLGFKSPLRKSKKDKKNFTFQSGDLNPKILVIFMPMI
jgi:hypothetical protein